MKTTTLILLWVLMAVLAAGSSWAQDIPEVMVLIDQGTYTPLYQTPYDTSAVTVDAFYLDVYPVTNADFLAFVKANPRWLRAQVTPLFTDENYLNHWDGDLTLGETAPANSPVVNVSWFAARRNPLPAGSPRCRPGYHGRGHTNPAGRRLVVVSSTQPQPLYIDHLLP